MRKLASEEHQAVGNPKLGPVAKIDGAGVRDDGAQISALVLHGKRESIRGKVGGSGTA